MRGDVVLERKKNNSSIGKKPPNLMRIKEENQYRKSQVNLAFLFLVVNQFLSWPVTCRIITLFAIYHCGQGCIELDSDHIDH